MTDADLDRTYTALCHALGAVGQERSELLLSMLCLALMARSDDAEGMLQLIARSRDRCQQEAQGGR